ncbi:HipA N-terminal domain-containing protein [Allochromatium humboldtianum]|uniref:HipA N-terminal domain-containing protein n=1 Tax=Allochromatium humboldtianum TaxID=504901 RepID=A0A850RGM0_9GAMM|nr:HipA N-terminal domain-containing protein [Allochromatium humboldtianum]
MRLEVWLDQERVGTLAYDATHHRFSFAYTDAWCARPAAYPLSPAARGSGPGRGGTRQPRLQRQSGWSADRAGA